MGMDRGRSADYKVKEKKELIRSVEPVKSASPKKHCEREIVRISGNDLPGGITIPRALQKIKGIGIRTSRVYTNIFEEKTKVSKGCLLGNIPPETDDVLANIITSASLPSWMVNRRKDIYSGEDAHTIGADLMFSVREDKQRLSRIKTRRGLRLLAGLPVRGQKTRSNFRRKQGAVGVVKAAQKPGAAPAKAAQPVAKGGDKGKGKK